MKLRVDTVLKNIDGTNMLGPKVNDVQKEATFSFVIAESLLHPQPGRSSTEVFENYLLAKRVYNATEVEFSIEELGRIKDLIAKAFAEKQPAVMGAAYELLETAHKLAVIPGDKK